MSGNVMSAVDQSDSAANRTGTDCTVQMRIGVYISAHPGKYDLNRPCAAATKRHGAQQIIFLKYCVVASLSQVKTHYFSILVGTVSIAEPLQNQQHAQNPQ